MRMKTLLCHFTWSPESSATAYEKIVKFFSKCTVRRLDSCDHADGSHSFVYIIKTDESPAEFTNRFKKLLGKHDKLFVATLTTPTLIGYTDESATFFKSRKK